MVLFWIVCALMLVVAALAFVVPIVSQTRLTGSTRDELNKQLYKNRIAELADDEDQGILEQRDDFVEEMQHGLLDDVVDDEKRVMSQVSSPVIWAVGLVFLVVFSFATYFTLGAKQKVADWEAVYARLPELTDRVMNDGKNITEQEISDFRLALTTRMANEPDNEFGWLLLGRLNVALGDSKAAFIAMDKAYKLAPKNSTIVTGYAQALMLSDDPEKVAMSKRILANLIEEKPNDIEVISTAAFMALENQDYLGAISQWQRMLPLLADQPKRLAMIEGSIAFARKQIESQIGNKELAPAKVEAKINTPMDEKANTKSSVKVTITSGKAGQHKGYLYVYVKAAQGPQAPLAVKRILDPVLPLTLVLTDEDAMMEQMKMSMFPSIKVNAKLSADAVVTTPADDITSSDVIVNEGDKREVSLMLAP